MDISSMLEVQVKEEMEIKENVTPEKDQATTSTALANISQEESSFYKFMFGNDISSVRFRRLHCTACDVHIGSAPAQSDNMFEHPVLRTLLCANCHEFYGDGTFEQGDDATDMFCRWCANGGNLYCCSYCSNTFCYKCIRRNFTSLIRKKIEADEKWKCFVCNPTDLYGARGTCWALLEHVKTMTRLLKNDKRTGVLEIERRMNLDESPCCLRRRRRKRRRVESNSEDEDETYAVENDFIGLPTPRKQFKGQKSRINPNGKVKPAVTKFVPIPIRPRPSSFLTGSSQSVTNSDKVNSSEGIALPSSSAINSNTSLPSRYDSNALQQSSLYHTTFMNSAGSNTFVRTSATINSVTQNRVLLPPQSFPSSSISTTTSTYKVPQPPLQSKMSYQAPPPIQSSTSYQQPCALNSTQNTMVSIPNLTDKNGRSLFLLPKTRNDLTLTPNIIDLDSDSDEEPKVVEQQNNLVVNGEDDIDGIDISVNKVVPVALTWEKNDDESVKEEQPLREICTTLTKNVFSFHEIMSPHSQALDKLLSTVKERQHCFFDLNNTNQDIEMIAQQKVKQFCCNMRNTVLQLANINDRIVREYNEWMRSRKTEPQTSSINEIELAPQENVEIPLDMICVNDSDTELDCEGSRYRIKEPSDLVKSGNIIENLLFSKKTVVHRGIGDDYVYFSADKETQYNIPRDYEKCISYSMLAKSSVYLKTDNTVLKQMSTPDKKFGKYEEQFIFYLQQNENHSIQIEDVKSLTDSNDISFQELIETNSPLTSDLLQNTNSSDMSVDELKICEQEKNEESVLNDHINLTNDINDTLKSTIDNNDQKIPNDLNTDTRIQETKDIRIQGIILLDKKLQQTNDDTKDGETTSVISNDNVESSIIVNNMVNIEASTSKENNSKENEDDCTIIDD